MGMEDLFYEYEELRSEEGFDRTPGDRAWKYYTAGIKAVLKLSERVQDLGELKRTLLSYLEKETRSEVIEEVERIEQAERKYKKESLEE